MTAGPLLPVTDSMQEKSSSRLAERMSGAERDGRVDEADDGALDLGRLFAQ